MPMQPDGSFAVRTPSEWRMIGTATWVDIYAALGRGEALTAQEIAARVGRTRQNIYFHLKKLEGVGLVRVVEHRPAVRRPEAVYSLVTPRVMLEPPSGRSTRAGSFSRTYDKLFRATSREFASAARSGRLRSAGESRDWVVLKLVARPTAVQRRQVRELAGRIHEILGESHGATTGEVWTVLFAALPLVDRPST
jgi:DNA-binding transcriptional ArsR family regulator